MPYRPFPPDTPCSSSATRALLQALRNPRHSLALGTMHVLMPLLATLFPDSPLTLSPPQSSTPVAPEVRHPSHQVLCVLPQVCSSIPGVVSRPRGSRPSHPLPLALALARAGAQGVLVMNKGRMRLEWGLFDKSDTFIASCLQFC